MFPLKMVIFHSYVSLPEGNDGFSFAIVVCGSAGGLNICHLQTRQCFKQPSSITPAASIFLQELRPRKFSRTEVWLPIPNSQLKTVQFLVCQRLHGNKYWCTWFWEKVMFFYSTRHNSHNSYCWPVVKQSCSKFVQELFPDWPTPMITDQECAPQLLTKIGKTNKTTILNKITYEREPGPPFVTNWRLTSFNIDHWRKNSCCFWGMYLPFFQDGHLDFHSGSKNPPSLGGRISRPERRGNCRSSPTRGRSWT